MIEKALILLHEESLRMTHPVFHAAPRGAQVIYIWDDEYIQRTGYSLKRLIFIYESLSELDVEILRGDTQSILEQINPSIVYIPRTNNPLLLEMIESVHKVLPVELVEDEPFVKLEKPMEYKRFFQYWGKAEKKAFLLHGGLNA
jgi:hypothetical protein